MTNERDLTYELCYSNYNDMRTVGDRFFEDKDAWVVGKYALEFLNAIFQIEKDEEELK